MRQRNPNIEAQDQSEDLFFNSVSIHHIDIPENTFHHIKIETVPASKEANTATYSHMINSPKQTQKCDDFANSIFNMDEKGKKVTYQTGGTSPKLIVKRQIKSGNSSGQLHLLRYSKSIPKKPKLCRKCTKIYGPEAYCQCCKSGFKIKVKGQKLITPIKPEVGIITMMSLNNDISHPIILTPAETVNTRL
jgi:type IV secretory pathway VirB4 component